jgi:hypothetical protein
MRRSPANVRGWVRTDPAKSDGCRRLPRLVRTRRRTSARCSPADANESEPNSEPPQARALAQVARDPAGPLGAIASGERVGRRDPSSMETHPAGERFPRFRAGPRLEQRRQVGTVLAHDPPWTWTRALGVQDVGPDRHPLGQEAQQRGQVDAAAPPVSKPRFRTPARNDHRAERHRSSVCIKRP